MMRTGLFLTLSILLISLQLPATNKTTPIKNTPKESPFKKISHIMNIIKKELTHITTYFSIKKDTYFGFIPFESRIKLQWPVKGQVIAPFGIGSNGINNGITIKTPAAQKIYAVAPGTVSFIGRLKGYGPVVIIKHSNNIYSVYTNLKKIQVTRGEKATKKTIIGNSGKLTNHNCQGLHFELYYKAKPVDPLHYLDKQDIDRPIMLQKNDHKKGL